MEEENTNGLVESKSISKNCSVYCPKLVIWPRKNSEEEAHSSTGEKIRKKDDIVKAVSSATVMVQILNVPQTVR